MSPNIISQFFGLFRIWGHPVVNTIQGVQKVRKAGCSPTYTDTRLPFEILYMFRVLFINGYLSKHRVLPSVTVSNKVSSYLNFQRKYNYTIDVTSPALKLDHMKPIQLQSVLSVEPTFNIASMMSDKALSPQYDKLVQVYRRTKGIGKAEDRRVILEWLRSNFVSAQELIQQVEKDGLPKNDHIIGVVPKEREMKINPRLFAIMTLKARLFFVVTESVLADHLLTNFPQITMSLSGIKLSKLLYNITKHQSSISESTFQESITMNIDFETWNLRMRDGLSRPLFEEFDKLFGYTNNFTLTHSFFSKSTVYVADEETELEVTPQNTFAIGPYCWTNHLGGFEGQRQKGWTILTVCMIELAAAKLKLNHQLIGQGDNQVLLIHVKIPPKRGSDSLEPNYLLAKTRYNQFKESFYNICTRAGLPLKKQETPGVFSFFYLRKSTILSRKSLTYVPQKTL